MSRPIYRSLLLSWLLLLIGVLVLVLLEPFVSDVESIGFLFVVIHSFATVLLILISSSKFKSIFVSAFILRVLILFWDLYARDIFLLPHSGFDSEFFYETSILASKNLDLLNTPGYRIGAYHKLLAPFFWLIGPFRIIAQYFNVLIGFMVVVTIQSVFNILHLNKAIQHKILWIAAVFPTSLILSGILLREIIITYLTCLSLYYFIKWLVRSKKLTDVLLSILMLGLASMFHSGVIGVLFGYIVGYLFYNHRDQKFEVTNQTATAFLFLSIVFIILFSQLGDSLLFKFQSAGQSDDVLDTIAKASGGSAYLSNMKINNPIQLILYGPIRAFYFISSPLPWSWRGGFDIFSFIADSSIYLYTFYYYFRNRHSFTSRNKCIIICILISILVTTFIFGLGVSNAGTAMRHRQKLLSLFLIMLAVMMNEKQRTLKAKYQQIS